MKSKMGEMLEERSWPIVSYIKEFAGTGENQ